ncbi:MAG: sulfotransferase family protein [Gammaproteobacteria bacterium]|nr:sulfotransferase family protein [Gammaproteobacteria bacterium]MDH3464722.1 sulfotransferase family protein [Gammaproteobacteria bacterium]
MTLKIIGTGFGRTGTNSLKLALEQLGFGPCHHMYEVRDNPEQLPWWENAARGDRVDWDVVFANYASCVDWPSARFWRELCEKFPNAKVLHSVRDEQEWISSVHQTIYPALRDWDRHEDGPTRDRRRMAYEIVVNQTFGGRLEDREHALDIFRAHNDEVCRTIPAERLLVYDVKYGWEPLCKFLDVPVPARPFPRVNSSDEFQQQR